MSREVQVLGMVAAPFLVDLLALGSVILIDLVLAGDNAVVIGMAASHVEPRLRGRAIAVGILLAMAFRISFASVGVQLLEIVGLLLAGGGLLLWVAWKMWRDLRATRAGLSAAAGPGQARPLAAVGFWGAILRITVADVSMSLDNVLAVAGAARHNLWILAFGLVLSIMLMGFAATLIARILDRHFWLNYLGLAIIAVVALLMIHEGAGDVLDTFAAETRLPRAM